MKAAVLYWSKTGNTAKAALAIKEGLEFSGVEVLWAKIEEAGEIDFFAYDLVCLGFPSINWLPAEPMTVYIKKKFSEYRGQGRVKVGCPKVSGKNALVFCTYSGPHTGMNEALTAGRYAGQLFEHLGFTVLDEWYILGEFHGSLENSTKGRMGDIRGKPTPAELRKLKEDAAGMAKTIASFLA